MGDSSEESDASPSLTDGEVAFSVHCCTAPPNEDNLISSVMVATIGPGIEFSAISPTGSKVINADVDISDDSIHIVYGTDSRASGGSFNGYVFRFLPTPERPVLPVVTEAELDSATTFPAGIEIDYVEDAIFVDVAEVNISAGSTISIAFELR